MKSLLKTLENVGNKRSALLVLPFAFVLGLSGCVSDGLEFSQMESNCKEPSLIFDSSSDAQAYIAPMHLPLGMYQRMESEVYISRSNASGILGSRVHYSQVPYSVRYPLSSSEFANSEVSLLCRESGSAFTASEDPVTLPDAFRISGTSRVFDMQYREFVVRFSAYSNTSLTLRDGGRSDQTSVSDLNELFARFWTGGFHFSRISENVYGFYGVRDAEDGSTIYAKAKFRLLK